MGQIDPDPVQQDELVPTRRQPPPAQEIAIVRIEDEGRIGERECEPIERLLDGAEKASAALAAVGEGVAHALDHGEDPPDPGEPGGQGTIDHRLHRVGEQHVRAQLVENPPQPEDTAHVTQRVEPRPVERHLPEPGATRTKLGDHPRVVVGGATDDLMAAGDHGVDQPTAKLGQADPDTPEQGNTQDGTSEA